jgi:hypothetical protein
MSPRFVMSITNLGSYACQSKGMKAAKNDRTKEGTLKMVRRRT